MRALLLTLVAAWLPMPFAAQATDTTGPDSARTDTATPGQLPAPPALPPSPEQQRYIEGLRRVARGISQLKVAVEQTNRARHATDSVARRRAVRRLGGYCGSARSFMAGGRAQMQPTAYDDTTRLKARRLSQRVDEIITYTRTCEAQAVEQPDAVTAELIKRLQAYEAALADFRSALGLQRDSVGR